MVSFTCRPLQPKGETIRYTLIEGWVDLKTGLDDMKKWKFLTLTGFELDLSAVRRAAIPTGLSFSVAGSVLISI
jgi:hypothetical protein